ncbi:MAG: ribosome maturation factor RimM [Mariprofundales bacterium]
MVIQRSTAKLKSCWFDYSRQLRKSRKTCGVSGIIQLGKITGVHGLHGVVRVHSFCDPAISIANYDNWFIGDSDVMNTSNITNGIVVKRCWQHGRRILATLAGIEQRDDAESIINKGIWISREQLQTDDDEYLWNDMLGIKVWQSLPETNVQQCLGTIAKMHDFGAQHTMEVTSDNGVWLLPFIDDIVQNVDIIAGRITVCLPEGMDACFTSNS